MILQSRNTHPEAQWFPKAGLGIFFHWGISAVDGDVDISWGMFKNWPYSYKILSPDEYFALAKDFHPRKYAPDKWIKAAKEAGFRYAVLTTRHHDSFALWPTEYGEFNTRIYMEGRDLLADYINACQKYGMKIGFYYSPPDFYTARHYRPFGGWQEERPVPETLKCYERIIAKGQIEELLSRYGKIDLIWFDGPHESIISDAEIKSLQPGIVIGRGEGRDFASVECQLPDEERYEKELKGKWWELCHEAGSGWSYNHRDQTDIKSLDTIVGWLSYTHEHNGNLLLNFGPDADGELTDLEYQRIEELGEYIKDHPDILPDWDEPERS